MYAIYIAFQILLTIKLWLFSFQFKRPLLLIHGLLVVLPKQRVRNYILFLHISIALVYYMCFANIICIFSKNTLNENSGCINHTWAPMLNLFILQYLDFCYILEYTRAYFPTIYERARLLSCALCFWAAYLLLCPKIDILISLLQSCRIYSLALSTN